MNDFFTISKKIDNAKTLDFGDVFGASIELFKKVWLQGLITVILTGVLAIPLVFIIYVPMVFLGIVSPESFDTPEPEGLAIFAIIITVLLFIVMLVFMLALQVGLLSAYFRIMKIKDLGLNQSDDYFFFFKRKYLGKTINLGLMMAGIYIVAFLFCVLPIFYAMIPLGYMMVIYAMNPDLPNKEIVKLGFSLGNKKWLFTFCIAFVSFILSMIVGFLMCMIGTYVTQQFPYLPFYIVYRDVVGFEGDANELDKIGLIEQ